MKYRIGLRNILLTVFLLVGSTNAFSHNDTITSTSIYSKTKPLQFGNELLINNQADIPESIPDYMVISGPAMDFYQNNLVYDPVRDPKRLLFHIANFSGAAIISFGILWVSPESFSGWDKDEIREVGFFNRWLENVKAGPIWDNDHYYLNWIVHPWSGAIYYNAARGSGLKWWESFLFSTFMSTVMWEYGVEAFAEIPSWQDLIITPTVGSAIGELFFMAKREIIKKDKRVLKSRALAIACLIVIDPFNGLLNAEGYKSKNKIQYYTSIAPIDYDITSGKRIWGMQLVANF